jgi:hypothetical protein
MWLFNPDMVQSPDGDADTSTTPYRPRVSGSSVALIICQSRSDSNTAFAKDVVARSMADEVVVIVGTAYT